MSERTEEILDKDIRMESQQCCMLHSHLLKAYTQRLVGFTQK